MKVQGPANMLLTWVVQHAAYVFITWWPRRHSVFSHKMGLPPRLELELWLLGLHRFGALPW